MLAGVTSARGKLGVEGYETVGWTNPNLTNAQCGNGAARRPASPRCGQPCNVTGGNGWRIPDTVPNNAVDDRRRPHSGHADQRRAACRAINPGLTTAQIGEALIPRLGRPVHMSGDRDRDSFLGSVQWRPADWADMYMDVLYTKAERSNDRIDMNLIGRNGGMIPINMQVDANNVVTSATFTNAQFFLEARPVQRRSAVLAGHAGRHVLLRRRRQARRAGQLQPQLDAPRLADHPVQLAVHHAAVHQQRRPSELDHRRSI